MPDRGLWDGPEMRGVRENAGVSGGVHAGDAGLLRREPGGRVQSADGGDAAERDRKVRGGRVRQGPERGLPVGAGGKGEGEGGGVPERVRRVQHGRVLLQRSLWELHDLPAHVLFAEV